MGINFSRLLTLKYGNSISGYLKTKYAVVSVGRVMTCVLGMVVRREREIREFVKTPFYRVLATLEAEGKTFEGEWKAVKGSRYFESFDLYKENGFKQKELQNDCSKRFKISPDETLRIVQELYEKKLVTYPRTDARVLSTAVAKEISKNLNGLSKYGPVAVYLKEIAAMGTYKNLVKTRYVNDKQITDHYAIIPTGQGLSALSSVSQAARNVYDCVVKRFLSIFYPPAVYQKVAVTVKIREESFLQNLKKGAVLPVCALDVKEGETSPPKRYNSGSMILAMENAGQLIEDEELRAQIKGSGIGTSATRAEILKKLIHIKYLSLNKKTQIITPTLQGEMVYDVVNQSIRSLLNPELTASWEKGLTYVADGEITQDEYMQKLDHFIISRTEGVKRLNNQYQLKGFYDAAAKYYKKPVSSNRTSRKKENQKGES